jgi:hypothetical protein
MSLNSVAKFIHVGTTLSTQLHSNKVNNKLNSAECWLQCGTESFCLPICYPINTNTRLDANVRLRVFENRVLRRLFGRKREEVKGGGENCKMRSLMICTPRPLLFQ